MNELHRALSSGSLQQVRHALSSGRTDINEFNDDGYTPLMEAVIGSNQGAIELLVRSGSSIDKSNDNGHSALVLSAAHVDTDTMMFLIRMGADVNAASGAFRVMTGNMRRGGKAKKKVACKVLWVHEFRISLEAVPDPVPVRAGIVRGIRIF